jgi:hypothetical protein
MAKKEDEKDERPENDVIESESTPPSNLDIVKAIELIGYDINSLKTEISILWNKIAQIDALLKEVRF